jgi:hypothetical protein
MNYFKKAVIYFATIFLVFQASAQQTQFGLSFCGTNIPSTAWEERFSQLIELRKNNTANKTHQNNYVIPVIIHVLHGGEPVGTYPNLPQGQLISQMEVLNNDFAGTGFSIANYPPGAFSAWAASQALSAPNIDSAGRVMIANCNIEFCLAKKDTLGNTLPEPGIDRVNYVSRGWANPASFSTNASFKNYMDGTVKQQTIWNVTKYLNIWVSDVNMSAFGLLGYATFPPLSGLGGTLPGGGTSTTDGFWSYAKTFGSVATYSAGIYYPGYNRGRTSTHEIGHWLGLRHIWGDGNCSASDYCIDTPPASASNFGNPTYPLKANTCAGNSPNGEMFMNFMDYTDDPAKYMFTTAQSDRIQTAMANSPYRKFLGTHNLCNVEYLGAAALFNNSNVGCTGKGVKLSNISIGYPAPTFTWTCPGASFTPGSNAISPNVFFSTPGNYTITLTANNGTLSTFSRTVNITSPLLNISSSAQTVCLGTPVNLEADGVDTFTWQPGNIVNYAVTYTPTQSQTYTCNATEVNGCTTTGTVTIIVSACTSINVSKLDQNDLTVYPNPAGDLINFKSISDKPLKLVIELSDAQGKIVLTQNFSFNKDSSAHTLNITQLSGGLYFLKVRHNTDVFKVVKLIKE